MDYEVTETAKAVQEVAKTAGKAIETTDKIGRFFSRVMKESVEAACGIIAKLEDVLKDLMDEVGFEIATLEQLIATGLNGGPRRERSERRSRCCEHRATQG